MKAIILAAGRGKRLGERGEYHPKSLLRFGGKSLLQRHIEILRHYQIEHVTIAVGYKAEAIEAEIKAIKAQDFVTTIHNPDYTEGSVVTLWRLGESIRCGDDFLLMDADVLYDRLMIEKLVNTNIKNCFLLDRDFEQGDEPVKLCVRENLLVEFRKKLAPDLTYDFAGESVGFFRFDRTFGERLAQATEEYVMNQKRDQPYEEVIRDLLLETPEQFSYEDVTGIPWIEIDFPEDILRAEKEILPKL